MFKQMKTAFCVLALCAAPLAYAVADDAPATTTGAGPVEKRITELHTKLKITADQETLWKAIAQEMRDSGKAFNEATRAREGKAATMTAIDDLNSYADLAAMHADSMKKFVGVFSPLYTAMSDDQKKNADEIFRGHKAAKHKKGDK